ncbi:MAG TPA: ABC transporter ATP-binding protein [Alphaproteobacteria bacterium]|nr:ABC transporter ATP-binding protein [Alphaproteobacteria bacterium]
MSTTASDVSPAIEVERVSKRYDRVSALDDVSLTVARGEVFWLLGPNGSGKSTLMRILAGSLLPSEGRARVAGRDVFLEPMQARRSIGYVPEMIPLYADMRVREFLSFMAMLRGLSASAAGEAVETATQRLELGAVIKRPIRQLSRGFRQRVALAQALLHDPEVLILDEPSNGLDPRQIAELRALLHALAGRHTILMSSHVLGEVEKTGGRVAVLMRGRLRGTRLIDGSADLEQWYLSLT